MAGPEPFVGRHAELVQLRAWVGEACDGAGGVALLTGPAGIGKTSLVEQVTAAPPGDPLVAWGRAVDDPGAPPLWPWRRILPALPSVDKAVSAALAEVDLLRDRSADAETARFRFTAAFADALLVAAEERPLLLVLEDLHWADAATLLLLRHVAGELRDARLLVLATFRASGSEALDQVLPELLRVPGVRSRLLDPLSEAEVGVYLTAVRGARTPDEGVHDAHRRSGGNPLYLRAISQGQDLRHLVRGTMSGLDPAARELVETAAVLGEEVDPAMLATVTERDEAEVTEFLDEAVRVGVLTTSPEANVARRFAHAIVRDVIYADLPPGVRAATHRRGAEAMEPLADRDPTLSGVAAGHWLRSGADPTASARTAHWATLAAASATRALAFDDTARFLSMALEALSRTDDVAEARADLLLDLATAEFRAGQFLPSLVHSVQASDAGEAVGRSDIVAAAALVVHDVSSPDLQPTLEQLCDRALTLYRDTLPVPTVSRLLAHRASANADVARLADALPLALEALRLAEESGDPLAIVDAARARMKVRPTAVAVEERMRLGQLAIDLARQTGQPLAALWGHKWRIEAALELGTMNAVDSEVAKVSALAAATRQPLIRYHELRMRAAIAGLRGQFDVGRELNREAAELAASRLKDDASAHAMTHAFLLVLSQLIGDPGILPADSWHVIRDLAPDIPVVVISRSLMLLMLGRREEAREFYEELRPQLTDPAFTASGIGVLLNIVHLVEAFDDVEVASVLLGRMAKERPYAAIGVEVLCSGSSARDLGRIALVCRRYDEAVAHLETALEVNIRTGARAYVVVTRLDLARALVERGDRADLDRGRSLAGQAADEARRLGMPGSLTSATQLAARIEERSKSSDPLTSREREISAMVAEGLTNRAVAEKLVLSERTVETHVRNILTKLALSNRTELAAWRVRTDRST
ncbi:MAG: AAA family ATPase [Sporichthyaceae bacterium]